MECLGGAGYVEGSPLPRLFRESPLNAIWEGSGNVIALDILRTLAREPASLEAYAGELELARGADRRLDSAVDDLLGRLRRSPPPEAEARYYAERMGILLQSALLARHSPAAVSDLFAATRIEQQGGRSFGAFAQTADLRPILDRQQGK
jgi:putative acyl-CoA dehydrogenase